MVSAMDITANMKSLRGPSEGRERPWCYGAYIRDGGEMINKTDPFRPHRYRNMKTEW